VVRLFSKALAGSSTLQSIKFCPWLAKGSALFCLFRRRSAEKNDTIYALCAKGGGASKSSFASETGNANLAPSSKVLFHTKFCERKLSLPSIVKNLKIQT
jgi:hypothetical protein